MSIDLHVCVCVQVMVEMVERHAIHRADARDPHSRARKQAVAAFPIGCGNVSSIALSLYRFYIDIHWTNKTGAAPLDCGRPSAARIHTQ